MSMCYLCDMCAKCTPDIVGDEWCTGLNHYLVLDKLVIDWGEQDPHEICKVFELKEDGEEMNDNRATELLPCPFCDHKRKKLVIHHRKCRWYEGGLYAVKCQICGIRGPYALSEEKAVEKWNTRHVET